MRLLEMTLSRPEEDLAADEVLLELQRDGKACCDSTSPAALVVVGYGNQVAREVNLAACSREVPVLRRIRRGTVLLGPGCSPMRWSSRSPTGRNWRGDGHEPFRHGAKPAGAEALWVGGPGPGAHGSHPGGACSGNAQRCRRRAVLFHGAGWTWT
jgi:hypothetical protein